MATRGYTCNRFPFLAIGERVLFQDGSFKTDDPELIALIERNDWFNIFIHPQDAPPPEGETTAEPSSPEPPPAPTEEESTPRVHRGSRGTR